MPGFRPAWLTNIRLKFDESLTLETTTAPTSVQDKVANPTQASTSSGQVSNEPLISQKDSFTWVMNRIPKELNFEKAGYRQAGKFSCTFLFKDLPIDPRAVRAAMVEVYVGAISDDEFARGLKGETDATGRRLSVLEPRPEFLRIVGTIDKWTVRNDSKGSIVRMEGRDLRGILLDIPVAPDGSKPEQFWDSLNLAQNIQDVVRQVLSYNPFFADILVACNPTDWPDGVLPSPGAKDLVPRHRLGARGKRQSGRGTPPAASSGTSLNFWDVIVRLCYLVGGIPFFVGNELVIRPSATVFDKLRGPVDPVKNPTPFLGGLPRELDAVTRTALNPTLRTRRLVYGRDTESVEFGRNYGGWRRPKIVRAISIDHDSEENGLGKVIMGIWPPQTADQAKRTRRSPGKETSQEEILNIPVPGVTDKDRLTLIARSVFEEIGRGEMSGQVETKNLASFGGDNTDPDLLGLNPGDGVELLSDTRAINSGAPLVSTYTDFSRKSFEEAVATITKTLGDANLARVIVATARGQIAELQRFFRVECVKYTCTIDKGVKISFDYQNYVVARNQAEDANTAPGTAQFGAVPGGGGGPASPATRGRSLRSI